MFVWLTVVLYFFQQKDIYEKQPTRAVKKSTGHMTNTDSRGRMLTAEVVRHDGSIQGFNASTYIQRNNCHTMLNLKHQCTRKEWNKIIYHFGVKLLCFTSFSIVQSIIYTSLPAISIKTLMPAIMPYYSRWTLGTLAGKEKRSQRPYRAFKLL